MKTDTTIMTYVPFIGVSVLSMISYPFITAGLLLSAGMLRWWESRKDKQWWENGGAREMPLSHDAITKAAPDMAEVLKDIAETRCKFQIDNPVVSIHDEWDSTPCDCHSQLAREALDRIYRAELSEGE